MVRGFGSCVTAFRAVVAQQRPVLQAPIAAPALLVRAVGAASLQQARHYAAADLRGKVAKTGQKKVDKKADDEGDALPFFYPAPAPGRLPSLGRSKPQAVGLPFEPRHKRESHRLLRAIDVEARQRHDADGREALVFGVGPTGAGRLEPGSVVLVEQLTSRSSPRRAAFAGVLVAVRRRGLLSSLTLRAHVAGTGVELTVPVFAPSVSRIKVLKRVAGFAGGRENVARALRERPGLAPVAFAAVDDLVLRDAEQERRLAAGSRR
ncbi:hypothetical protein HK405_010544 [Cladochytrium tenue]|nr:hypothetical protein HK405_010544 [Cladochytrium tenue]